MTLTRTYILQGITYSQGLRELILEAKSAVRDKWDECIAITGGEGVGKSTLGNIICILADDKFTFERNILFVPDFETIKSSITGLPKYSAINLDEAIKVAYKMEFWSKLQIQLNKFFTRNRKENQIVIFCIPNFQDLNSFFRKHRIKLWIHVVARGLAVAFRSDPLCFTGDKWHIRENEKIIKKLMGRKSYADLTINEIIHYYSKTKNFICSFEFSDLSPEVQSYYEKLKDSYEYGGVEELQEKYGDLKDVIAKLMYLLVRKFEIKQTHLARFLGWHKQRVSRYVRNVANPGLITSFNINKLRKNVNSDSIQDNYTKGENCIVQKSCGVDGVDRSSND